MGQIKNVHNRTSTRAKLFFNNFGMSLAELMVTMGMTAVLGLITSSVILQTYKSSQGLQIDIQADSLSKNIVNEIVRAAQDNRDCSTVLKSVSGNWAVAYPAMQTSAGQQVTITMVKSGGQTLSSATGNNLMSTNVGTMAINDISIANVSNQPLSTTLDPNTNAVTSETYAGELYLRASPVGSVIKGVNTTWASNGFRRFVSRIVFIRDTGTNLFKSCQVAQMTGSTTATAFCNNTTGLKANNQTGACVNKGNEVQKVVSLCNPVQTGAWNGQSPPACSYNNTTCNKGKFATAFNGEQLHCSVSSAVPAATIVQVTGPTPPPPPPSALDCTPATYTWGDGVNNCSAPGSTIPNNSVPLLVTSSSFGFSGTATFSCINGVLSAPINPICTVDPTASSLATPTYTYAPPVATQGNAAVAGSIVNPTIPPLITGIDTADQNASPDCRSILADYLTCIGGSVLVSFASPLANACAGLQAELAATPTCLTQIVPVAPKPNQLPTANIPQLSTAIPAAGCSCGAGTIGEGEYCVYCAAGNDSGYGISNYVTVTRADLCQGGNLITEANPPAVDTTTGSCSVTTVRLRAGGVCNNTRTVCRIP